MRINMSDEYVTRDGEPVEIYTTGAPNPYPVIGVRWSNVTNTWVADQWTISGEHYDSPTIVYLNLKPKRKEHTVYVNVYREGQFLAHDTKDSAHRSACTRGNVNEVVAVAVPFTYTEGHNFDLLPD